MNIFPNGKIVCPNLTAKFSGRGGASGLSCTGTGARTRRLELRNGTHAASILGRQVDAGLPEGRLARCAAELGRQDQFSSGCT